MLPTSHGGVLSCDNQPSTYDDPAPERQVIKVCVWMLRYALIVLWADDNGQGGAFALFSLLKRQAELGKKSKVSTGHF